MTAENLITIHILIYTYLNADREGAIMSINIYVYTYFTDKNGEISLKNRGEEVKNAVILPKKALLKKKSGIFGIYD